jgi:hypothetical protein
VPYSKGTDYPVGYRRPPAHTRFRKGQSGNPSGRRGWSPNFAMQLEKALQKVVSVKINGRTRRITRQELIAEQAVNRAAAGDSRYLKLLFGCGLLDGDSGEQLVLRRDKDGRLQFTLALWREFMNQGDENRGDEEGSD